ncbi:MAG: hypothetical protein CFE21_03960 [Bacteroidetes bacterium B1(2017)]|nr:MAG: hypothetical protein CFE21_03960 [Bacteroidetes bacterium B1(2017)]
MAKGDIVLINFPFTDLTGSKLRPAIILAESTLDLTVCFITTQIQRQELLDIPINPNSTNRLKNPSLIRISKIATLDKTIVKGLLGKISNNEISIINSNLRTLFNL